MKHRQSHIKHKIKNLKPKKLIVQRLWFWIILLSFIIGIIGIYALFFWSKFQIKNIAISGNEKIKANDIESFVLANMDKNIFANRIFTIDAKNLTEDVLTAFPVIKSVRVQKKWPQGIELIIKERSPVAVFCDTKNPNACFLMDDSGIIFEPTENIPQDMFLVNLKNDKEFIIGQTAVKKMNVDIILKVLRQLKDNFQIDIKKAVVSDILVITTSENWQIYFDTTSGIDTQIMKMNALLKTEIPPNIRKNLQYIYLQYKDRAYYK